MTIAFKQKTEDVEIEFRLTTNGIIVNTLNDGKAMITTGVPFYTYDKVL